MAADGGRVAAEAGRVAAEGGRLVQTPLSPQRLVASVLLERSVVDCRTHHEIVVVLKKLKQVQG
jgi:hypothetical protein